VKYKCWASTERGNTTLSQEYLAAQGPPRVLIYLFFSVNTSGQFVGMAEMTSDINYSKNMDLWMKGGKWKGVFDITWHFIKDVPNTALRQIKVPSNDNKPVPNSRDTQQLGQEAGREVLRIFAGHAAETSLLDDFDHYDEAEPQLQKLRQQAAQGDAAADAAAPAK